MAAMWSPIIALLLLLLPLVPSSSSVITLPLHGNVYPVGHYYVTMKIGKHPKPYFLDIDTGSNLTWLECHHQQLGCQHCTRHLKHPHYSPQLSNLKMECQHKYCDALRKDLAGNNPQCPHQKPHQCHYQIQYLDGTTDGVISIDTISLRGNEKSSFIAFGCGYNQLPQKETSPVDGILGLGMGTVGFVPQLMLNKMITKNIIGHCLGKDGGGYLSFGEQFDLERITWAPMRKYELFYSPGQATLHLNGQQIYKHGVNAVFDSGTCYTYIPARIYNPFVHTVQDMIGSSHREVHDDDLPQCWKFKSIDEVKRLFKPLSLQFHNKIAMHIPAMNYLIHTRSNNWCLAILNGTQIPDGDRRILIGDATMRDMLVIYDNQHGMLGWVNNQQCTRPHPASRL
ncbi:aspartic proteinase Asp1 [Triticum aestivum]|nr:aspartic proteinase Asp1-like [Triticum aestivum]